MFVHCPPPQFLLGVLTLPIWTAPKLDPPEWMDRRSEAINVTGRLPLEMPRLHLSCERPVLIFDSPKQPPRQRPLRSRSWARIVGLRARDGTCPRVVEAINRRDSRGVLIPTVKTPVACGGYTAFAKAFRTPCSHLLRQTPAYLISEAGRSRLKWSELLQRYPPPRLVYRCPHTMKANAGSPLDLLVLEFYEAVLATSGRLASLPIVGASVFSAVYFFCGIPPWTVVLLILNCAIATVASGIVSKMSLAEETYVPESLEDVWADSTLYFIVMVSVSMFLAVWRDLNS
ncbi:MAG: hypothetical protein KVP17_004888 [Porospora cf. gigantea B]|uniref:uncharacterized protein n=1 Tax=Porospora cf. gigantea B TaxID=2853592 RepID=UPI003571C5DA|nr:MAG: hypothetical protein KVP17_004888 [Porospora cf. gigantea B]